MLEITLKLEKNILNKRYSLFVWINVTLEQFSGVLKSFCVGMTDTNLQGSVKKLSPKKCPEECLPQDSVKVTVENMRDSVEKLYPKESVEGCDTALWGSVRAPNGFF